MKRKIKRKLFLMGMALAAGMPVAGWAKGSSKPGHLAEHYRDRLLSDSGLAVGSESHGISIDAIQAKLNRLTGAMHDNGIMPALVKPPVMQFQMLPAAQVQPDDPRTAGEKRLGVALHIAF